MTSAPAVLQSFTNASEQIVTNCDVGASCGALPLLYTSGAVAVVAAGAVFVHRRIR